MFLLETRACFLRRTCIDSDFGTVILSQPNLFYSTVVVGKDRRKKANNLPLLPVRKGEINIKGIFKWGKEWQSNYKTKLSIKEKQIIQEEVEDFYLDIKWNAANEIDKNFKEQKWMVV